MKEFLDFVNQQLYVNTAYEYAMLALMSCMMIVMLTVAIPVLLVVSAVFAAQAVIMGKWERLYDKGM